jgi:hypothetical protein
MSLVLRFVDTDMNIREEFIAFLHCKWGLSGAQLVLEALNDLTLSIEDCRGQGYDGAGSVAAHQWIVCTYFKAKLESPLYTLLQS